MSPSLPDPLRFQPIATAPGATEASTPDVWREWDVLADRLGAPPFHRPGWYRAWHGAFGRGELRLLTARDGERLAAVLPVEIRDGAILSPTNSHTPLYGPVAETAAAEQILADQLVLGRPTRIELSYLDPATSWCEVLRATLPSSGRANRRSVLGDVLTHPPYVSTAPGWDAYLAHRPRKFVKELRRQRRRLGEHGTLTFDVHTAASGLEAALNEFVALESSGWKVDEGTAIALAEPRRRFYEEIARWAAIRGWLRLAFLRLDGRAIAAEFDIACARSLHSLKSGFDPEYRGFGPGQLLTHDCIKLAFDEGLASYEFLGTDEPYKMSWTDATHARVRLRSFPRTVKGDLTALARHHARPVVRRLRRG